MSEEVYFSNLDWIKTHDDIGGVRGTVIFKNNMTYEDYKEISHKTYLLLEESQQKEIEILNNIINEIEAIIYNDQITGIEARLEIQERLDKLQELKGSE